MIKRFNYTGRKKLGSSRVSIYLTSDSDGRQSFTASLDLNELELPEQARVYIEAYYRNSYMRFDFGTVRAMAPPPNRELTDIDSGRVVFFRVKIVDETGQHGRLLAEGNDFMPRDSETVPADRRCILPVDYRDLGEEIWRVELDNQPPVLEVNKSIPNIQHIAVRDPVFAGHVYPAVLRQVLTHFLVIEGNEEGEESDAASQWLKFVRRFYPEPLPRRTQESDDASTRSDFMRWIEAAAAAFADAIKARSKCVTFTSPGGER